MNGKIFVVGLGPGDPSQITPQVSNAIDLATDVIVYVSYVD